MKHILIFGAGKSSTLLIDYLAEHAVTEKWRLTVADLNKEAALHKTQNRPRTQAVALDSTNSAKRQKLIATADVVVSMLPAALHLLVANDCLLLKKHLVTPSYISPEMAKLNNRVKQAGLIFINEMGLDPGIDHLSAMHLLNRLRHQGATITGFESHCGGLVAPASDNNLWHYKFTWNPRNVVLAGQGKGGIHYLKNGREVTLRYSQLFLKTTLLQVKNFGTFESYANRDSLKYEKIYGLKNVKTIYRGTLRIPPFCKGWNGLIQLGLTTPIELNTERFQENFRRAKLRLQSKWDTETTNLIRSLKLDTHLKQYDSATIIPSIFLQTILEEKWKMRSRDKDMIVMVHRVAYQLNRKPKRIQASLVVTGKDSEHTAMAKTVGLPMALAVKLILQNRIKRRGVLLPVYPEIYNPILAELKTLGIEFKEENI